MTYKVDREYDFVAQVLKNHDHLRDKKIEFIKAFRGLTGYGLKDSKDLIESYLGQTSSSIYWLLKNQVNTPERDYEALGISEDRQNPAVPENYLIVSDDMNVNCAYVAQSKEEAKRFANWLGSQRHFGIRVYVEVKL